MEIAFVSVFRLLIQSRITCVSILDGKLARIFTDFHISLLFSLNHAIAIVHKFELFLFHDPST